MAEQRYEREINELLKRLEGEHREPLPFRVRRRTSPWAGFWRRASTALGMQSVVERLMALAVALLAGTILFGFVDRGFAWLIGMLAIACFVGALTLSVWAGATGHRPRHEGNRYPQPGAYRHVDWDALRWRLRHWLRRFR